MNLFIIIDEKYFANRNNCINIYLMMIFNSDNNKKYVKIKILIIFDKKNFQNSYNSMNKKKKFRLFNEQF